MWSIADGRKIPTYSYIIKAFLTWTSLHSILWVINCGQCSHDLTEFIWIPNSPLYVIMFLCCHSQEVHKTRPRFNVQTLGRPTSPCMKVLNIIFEKLLRSGGGGDGSPTSQTPYICLPLYVSDCTFACVCRMWTVGAVYYVSDCFAVMDKKECTFYLAMSCS